jgi:hypothetical protein
MSKNLTAKDVHIGDEIKAKNDTYSSYGITKGEHYKIVSKNGANVMVEGFNMWTPLNIFEKSNQTKTELHRQKSIHLKAITEIDNKLEWMEATGSNEYSETEYKVWQVLQQMKSDLPERDKIVAIAKLIKG